MIDPATRPFRLFGFPITVRASFLILIAIFGVGGGSDPVKLLLWVAIAFVSILLHELGHAFAGRAFGMPSEIEFHALGGVTKFGRTQLTPTRDLLISLAGPAVSISLGVGLLFADGRLTLTAGSLADTAMGDAIFANLGWGLFNLSPVLPLDGGHALRAFLRLVRWGDAELVARVVSLVTLAVMAVFSLLRGFELWNLLFLANFAFANGRALREHLANRGSARGRDSGFHRPVTRGGPGPLRAAWLKLKLWWIRRGDSKVKIDLEEPKPKPKGPSPLRVVQGGREEPPPKDKRWLN